MGDDGRLRTAFKVAYLGSAFQGLAAQPGHRTVEGVVGDAIRSVEQRHGRGDGNDGDVGGGRVSPHLRFLSRTDRGVSSLENILIVSHTAPVEAIIAGFNSVDDPVWLTHKVEWPKGRSMKSTRKVYRYLLNDRSIDGSTLAQVAQSFIGTHDFRRFSRTDKVVRDPIRTIDSVEVRDTGHGWAVDVMGDAFLWEMVRRMVSAMVSCARGDLDPAVVESDLRIVSDDPGIVPDDPGIIPDDPGILSDDPGILSDDPGILSDDPGDTTRKHPPMPPDNLILWTTLTPGLVFEPIDGSRFKSLDQGIERYRDLAVSRAVFLDELVHRRSDH